MFVSVYLSVCPRAYLRNCSPISLFLCVLLSCVVALRYAMFHNIILHIITRRGNSGATMRILKVTQQGTAPDRGGRSLISTTASFAVMCRRWWHAERWNMARSCQFLERFWTNATASRQITTLSARPRWASCKYEHMATLTRVNDDDWHCYFIKCVEWQCLLSAGAYTDGGEGFKPSLRIGIFFTFSVSQFIA